MNLSNLKTCTPECMICFYETNHIIFCRQCSFGICPDCFKKLNKGKFTCPKCGYIPGIRSQNKDLFAKLIAQDMYSKICMALIQF